MGKKFNYLKTPKKCRLLSSKIFYKITYSKPSSSGNIGITVTINHNMCELYKSDKELCKNSPHKRNYLYIVGIYKGAG